MFVIWQFEKFWIWAVQKAKLKNKPLEKFIRANRECQVSQQSFSFYFAVLLIAYCRQGSKFIFFQWSFNWVSYYFSCFLVAVKATFLMCMAQCTTICSFHKHITINEQSFCSFIRFGVSVGPFWMRCTPYIFPVRNEYALKLFFVTNKFFCRFNKQKWMQMKMIDGPDSQKLLWKVSFCCRNFIRRLWQRKWEVLSLNDSRFRDFA